MPVAPTAMPDMENLHRPVDDGVIDAPAGCAAIERAANGQIEGPRLRRNRMRLGHSPEAKDGIADACKPFVGSPWVAVAQPDP